VSAGVSPARGAWLCGFGAALLAATVLAQPPGYPQPLPPPAPLLPADNWWNVDVQSAPVDPRSDAFLANIGLDRGMHPDFGGTAGGDEIYGMPYAVVPGSQPLVPVTFVLYGDESDAGAPGRPPGYPIPDAARNEPRWIEGGPPGNQPPDGDRHFLIVDRDRQLLFELYRAHWNVARGRWEAGSGAVWPLTTNHRRPEGWTSADAAGLAILPGLARFDEVDGDAPIRHALRVTVEETNGHVFPASHTAGDRPGALPLGARLRLKSGVDLAGFPPRARKLFEAMKTYGLIVADNGSDLYVQGTFDPRWDNDELNPAFRRITARDFEVVALGWRPGGAAGPPARPTGLQARALGPRRVGLTWVDRSGDETGFVVEIKRGSGSFEPVATAPADATGATVGGLAPRTRYVFRVRAQNGAGTSRPSNTSAATTPQR
jgi:hypothetical protein